MSLEYFHMDVFSRAPYRGNSLPVFPNDGLLEDVATGSAAGTIGAYCLHHGLARGGELFILNQGRFTGRPSTLRVQPEGTPEAVQTVKVGGDVVLVGRGMLEVLP